MAPLLTAPPGEAAQLRDADFQTIRKLVYDHFGINLSDQKRSMVMGRLQKVLRSRGFSDYGQYLAWLETDRSGEGLEELACRISTNHTFFFREHAHFDFFRQTVLPELDARVRRTGDPIRIWSAGCSSGEEPYMLAMLLTEHFGSALDRMKVLLLATDLSTRALQTAMSGVYNDERVQKMPAELRSAYFKRVREDEWEVTPAIRKRVVYRRHNLMDAAYPFKNPFDAIFCRNVMIYFDRPTRDTLVGKFAKHLAPGGYLFIGHSETLGRDNGLFQYVMPAAYRKPV